MGIYFSNYLFGGCLYTGIAANCQKLVFLAQQCPANQEEYHRIHDKWKNKDAAADKVQITEANKWGDRWGDISKTRKETSGETRKQWQRWTKRLISHPVIHK